MGSYLDNQTPDQILKRSADRIAEQAAKKAAEEAADPELAARREEFADQEHRDVMARYAMGVDHHVMTKEEAAIEDAKRAAAHQEEYEAWQASSRQDAADYEARVAYDNAEMGVE